MSSPPPATACGPKVATHEPEIVRHERVWGPVPSDRTEARHAASSVLIRPHDVQLERCRKNVLAEVPAGVLPMADDTPKTLSSRLAKSDWLDSIHALKGGNGKGNMRRVALNATDYAQPRRVTMSVPAGGVHVDGDGDSVQSLYEGQLAAGSDFVKITAKSHFVIFANYLTISQSVKSLHR